METIDLSKFEPQETLNHTSKGNQLKWKCDGYWYKADHMGYEGLAETIVSALLASLIPVDILLPLLRHRRHDFTQTINRT